MFGFAAVLEPAATVAEATIAPTTATAAASASRLRRPRRRVTSLI
jgi:hypothetical protein